ncbi:MAG: ATP-binding protein [Desulfobulbaceae bacterium]|nr:ATP-binding protein [Desulfobulbaceae bacterium]HIJ78415.1 response regulator [Deltaproteobacteria bacterium]
MEPIKKTLLIPLALAMFLLLAISFFNSQWGMRKQFNDEIQSHIKSIDKIFQSELSKDAQLLEGLSDFLAKDDNLQKAWLSQNRQALLNYSSPIFDRLKAKYRITHFYFHDLNQINFLRVHNPIRHGDHITRHTLREAAEKQKTSSGIELGPFGTFTLRVVTPWRINNKVVGYLELGEEIEHISKNISALIDVDLIFLIDKKHLNRSNWEEGLRMLGHQGDWDTLPNSVISDKTMATIPDEINRHISRHQRAANPIFNDFTLANGHFTDGILPLYDVAHTQVGEIIVLHDITHKKNTLTQLSIRQTMVTILIGLGLFFIFFQVISRLEGRLAVERKNLLAEINKREKTEQALRQNGERFDYLLSSTPAVIYTCETSGDFPTTFISDNVRVQLGYEPLEFTTDSRFRMRLIHPDDRQRVQERFSAMLKKGGRHTLDYRMQHKNGSYRWIRDESDVTCEGEKIPIEIIGAWTDITELKHSQEGLLATEKILRQINSQLNATLESTTDGIMVVDTSGRILKYNKNFADLWAIPGSIISAGDDAKVLEYVLKQLQKPNEFLDKVKLLYNSPNAESFDVIELKDGLVFERFSRPLIVDGQGIGRVWGFHNITDQRISENELRRAKEAAEAANDAKSQFLANMSHEIRTPMNAIIGLTELAMLTPLNPEQQEYLGGVKKSSTLLLKIINNILDYSKIEAGHLELEKHPFSLLNTFNSVHRSLNLEAMAKGLELDFAIAPEVPKTLLGDDFRLHQIIMNLMANAIKFTNQGAVKIYAAVAKEKEDKLLLEFCVADSGGGIAGEKLPHIFESFSQADNSITRQYGGTGLGLAICKSLVGLFGGDIRVESELGKGSRFYFTAWLQKAQPAMAQIIAEKPLPPTTSPTPTRSLKILLVEDNEFNTIVAQQLLLQQNHRVACATTGLEALKILTGKDFDLILMDIQMPDMDGLTATRLIRLCEQDQEPDNNFSEHRALLAELRRKIKGRKTPIIAITAHALSGDEQKYREAGINDYLSKPFIPADLYAKIEANTFGLALPLQAAVQITPTSPETGAARIDPRSLIEFLKTTFNIASSREAEAMLNIAIKTLQKEIAAGEKALADKNLDELCRVAHGLKGTLGNLGLSHLSAAAKKIEKQQLETEGDKFRGLNNMFKELTAPLTPLIKKYGQTGG